MVQVWELDNIKKYADTVAAKVANLEAEIKNLKNEQSGVIKPYLSQEHYNLPYLEDITEIDKLENLKDNLVKTFNYNKEIVAKNATIYKENLAVKDRLVMLITNSGFKKTRTVRRRGKSVEVAAEWLSDLAIFPPIDLFRTETTYKSYVEKIDLRIAKIKNDTCLKDKSIARDQYLVEKGKAILKYEIPLDKQEDHWTLINYLRTHKTSFTKETVEILEKLKSAM